MEIVRLVLGAVRIGAAPLNLSINSGGFTNARGDGTFTFNSVLPGAYSLTSSMSGWWLRSAIANGRDILDLPLQVDPAASDLPPVVVTVHRPPDRVAGNADDGVGPAAQRIRCRRLSGDA